MIKTSYPYLALSKKHNIKYGNIIDVAWLMRQGYPVRLYDWRLERDLLVVQAQHKAMQDGRRSWDQAYEIQEN